MCNCKQLTKIGNYEEQTLLIKPWKSEIQNVCVDNCMINEIKFLWSLGIITTGCCCGHNQLQGYIGVQDKFIPSMKQMGYEVHYNPCRPNDEDSFIAKMEDF